MKTFTDSKGLEWPVELKYKDVELVRRRVVDAAGQPVNLLDLADTGELYKVCLSARVMVEIVFICCLDDIRERFDEAAFDASHEIEAELNPELKTDKIRKMGCWFGERLNGKAIEEMTDAFKEAIVDFTRNPHQREALRTVLENQARLYESQARRVRKESSHMLEVTEQAMETRLQEELEQMTPEKVRKQLESSDPGPS